MKKGKKEKNKKKDALNASFWHFSDSMIEHFVEEPDGDTNRQILPIQRYYKHGVSNCELDYSRAVLSLPLRGLQGKTQVFPMDRESFARSRLTHTLEVAVNAAEIFDEIVAAARTARETAPEGFDDKDLLDDEQLQTVRYALMTACLLHDAGNPPFGHFGEATISDWFRSRKNTFSNDDSETSDLKYLNDLCHYEGNANSMRIALHATGLYDGRRMNPTLLTLSALIKYPRTSVEAVQLEKEQVKYNFFYSDMEQIDRFSARCEGVNHKGGERVLTSYIMEASDDISYVTSDFEDAFRRDKFTIFEVVVFLTENWHAPNDYTKRQHSCSFTLIYLLAFIAGDEEAYRWMKKFIKEDTNNSDNLIARDGIISLKAASYLLPPDASSSNRGDETVHTYRAALSEWDQYNLDAAQKKQMQETYVARWVDIVRKWLIFSSAASLKQGEPSKRENALFGDHTQTVALLKDVLKHFVYESPDNAKLNARAETVLKGLLDKFIPASEECIRNKEADTESKAKKNPVHPDGISSTSCALISLIPMRYRMDYEGRYRASAPNWDEDRQRYELDMMVLDFVSSLPDDYAIQLYNDLYNAG